jgi:hypothetical protein
VPVCERLDEGSCIDRTDGCHDWSPPGSGCGDLCAPQYEGIGCSCDGDACSCEDWIYVSCASAGAEGSL